MNNTEIQYQKDSPVGKNKERITELVTGHWQYKKKDLQSAMIEPERKYTLDQVMAMREWDYTSAMIHGYGHGYEDATQGLTLTDAIERQKTFALKTFGPGSHATGLLDHIKKELIEISEDPTETEEWIDVIILAMEGAWRTGASSEDIAKTFELKMSKNERRKWPVFNTIDPDKAIEHISDILINKE